jgi:hypothetical protein
MAPSRPTSYPDWALQDITDPISGQPNVSEPDTIHSGTGIDSSDDPILPNPPTIEGVKYLERTPRRWFNWLQRFNGYWVRWLDYITQSHDTTLTTHGNEISTLQNNATTDENAILALQSDVSTIDNTLDGHGQSIVNLQNTQGAQDIEISAINNTTIPPMQDAISTLINQMVTATDTNNSQDGSITSLNSRTNSLEGSRTVDEAAFATLKSDTTGNSYAGSPLHSRLDTDEGLISTLNTNTGVAAPYAGQSLKTRMDNAESSLGSQMGEIDNLKTAVGTPYYPANSLDSRVSTNENEISALDTNTGAGTGYSNPDGSLDTRLSIIETHTGAGVGYDDPYYSMASRLDTHDGQIGNNSSDITTINNNIGTIGLIYTTIHFGQIGGTWQYGSSDLAVNIGMITTDYGSMGAFCRLIFPAIPNNTPPSGNKYFQTTTGLPGGTWPVVDVTAPCWLDLGVPTNPPYLGAIRIATDGTIYICATSAAPASGDWYAISASANLQHAPYSGLHAGSYNFGGALVTMPQRVDIPIQITKGLCPTTIEYVIRAPA